ncbi:MAG: SOS response-associated peptidase [Acidimicrobiales bacterium]
MCGRYVSTTADPELAAHFKSIEAVGDPPAPSWNVAPTDRVRIVVERTASPGRVVRQLRSARWGLVPSWSRSPWGTKMINARSETVSHKPAFKAAAGRRRCLAPANGYFEWKKEGTTKIPFFLHDPSQPILAMAGLYEIWSDESLPADHPDRWLWTCTIITRPAHDALGAIHDRCPVLVPQALYSQWLDCSDGDALVAEGLLGSMSEPHLHPRQVSKDVGKVANNGPALIEPVGEGE